MDNPNTPSVKVTAGVVTGVVVSVVTWALTRYTGVDVTPELASAIAAVVGGIVAYFIPETNPSPSAIKTVLYEDDGDDEDVPPDPFIFG